MSRNLVPYLNLGLFFLLAALPLLAGLGYALLYSFGLTGMLNEGFTLQHWEAVFRSGAFWSSLGFSMLVAFLTLLISTGLALAAALHWLEDFRKGWLSYLIYLPLTFPAMVVAFFLFQLLSKGGFLSRLSYQLGWTRSLEAFPNWVNDPYGIGIVTAHVFMATPFFILLFVNLYQSERLKELSFLAATLGAGSRQVTWKVVIPVLIRRSVVTLMLYFIFVMGSYEVPLLLGSQSPQMISMLTIRKLQKFNLYEIPQAYAVSAGYVWMVVLLVCWLLNRRSRAMEKTML